MGINEECLEKLCIILALKEKVSNACSNRIFLLTEIKLRKSISEVRRSDRMTNAVGSKSKIVLPIRSGERVGKPNPVSLSEILPSSPICRNFPYSILVMGTIICPSWCTFNDKPPHQSPLPKTKGCLCLILRNTPFLIVPYPPKTFSLE